MRHVYREENNGWFIQAEWMYLDVQLYIQLALGALSGLLLLKQGSLSLIHQPSSGGQSSQE